MESTELPASAPDISNIADFFNVIVVGMILTPRNLVIVFSTWFLIRAVLHAFPPRSTGHRVILRSRELIYIGGCTVMVWAPGLQPEIQSWGYRLGLGVLLGGATSLVPWAFHLLGKRFGVNLLKDPRCSR